MKQTAAHNWILAVWALLTLCVIVGSLLPAKSPIMVAVGDLHVSDKILHFSAYLALSSLPVIGFRDRRRGFIAAASMFCLSLSLEAAQHFSPGRAVEFGDVLANAAGITCGALLALPLRFRAPSP